MKRTILHWLPMVALGCAVAYAQTETPTRLPAELELAPGSWISVRVNEMVSSNSAREGDLFSATLTQPLIADGVVVARRGQMVTGRVTSVARAGKVKGSSRLGVELTELTLADGRQAGIRTQLVEYSGGASKGRDATAVGTAAGVGAAIGAVAGGGVGAGAGAGAGAAAGLAGVLLTRGRQTVLYPEDMVTFRLTDPVIVHTDRAPLAFRYAQQSDYERGNSQRPELRRRETRPPYYAGWGYPGWGWGPYWGPGWGPGRGWYGGPRIIVHRRGWRR
ncbi:MAG: hypothetical protein IT164_02505 [Bryobacterales bacterium]|nr:hypothetical protein [Bryobacterales bacterium]